DRPAPEGKAVSWSHHLPEQHDRRTTVCPVTASAGPAGVAVDHDRRSVRRRMSSLVIPSRLVTLPYRPRDPGCVVHCPCTRTTLTGDVCLRGRLSVATSHTRPRNRPLPAAAGSFHRARPRVTLPRTRSTKHAPIRWHLRAMRS